MKRRIASALRDRRQPQTAAPRWHPRASGSLALWQLDGYLALFQPLQPDDVKDSTREWCLPGGSLEQDEVPEEGLRRALLGGTGLDRKTMRLLVIESVRADPARGTPAGENFLWQVEPLTRREWEESVRLSEALRDKRLVLPGDLGLLVRPEVERRILAGLKALDTRTILHLPPSH